MRTTDDLLRVEGLCKDFGDFHALKDISFSMGRGKMVGLIGPNGCGKSTMMKCICRIHDLTAGRVSIDGEDVSGMRLADVAKVVATVPAEPGDTFGMSVMDMVMLGRYPFVDRIWWETPEDEEKVREALRTFGLDGLRRKQVSMCSSGERQRALIAKAYVQEPKLMLVDEPTSHLDMKYKLDVMEYLQGMSRTDMTVMVAEHDISLMARYCDVCIIMKRGEIVTIGDPKEVITEGLIRDVYEVDARVGLDEDGEIYVLPKRFAGHRDRPRRRNLFVRDTHLGTYGQLPWGIAGGASGTPTVRYDRIAVCRCCGREWQKRGDADPARCPSCGSRNWKDGCRESLCRRCGYRWVPNRGNPQGPAKCPKCRSSRWRDDATGCICRICGYAWVSRSSTRLPYRCPKCRSARWSRACEHEREDALARRAACRAGDKEMSTVIKRVGTGERLMAIAVDTGLPLSALMDELNRQDIYYVL